MSHKANKTARRIAEVSERFRGRAFLYQLSGYPSHEYVVASAVYSVLSGPETVVFPCDSSGDNVVFSELGAVKKLSPDKAVTTIHDAGQIEIVSPPLDSLHFDSFITIPPNVVRTGNLIQFTDIRISLFCLEGKWESQKVEGHLEHDFWAQMDRLDSNYCMLLSQPRFEKNFQVFIFEILKGEKVLTVLANSKNSKFEQSSKAIEDEVRSMVRAIK